MLKGSYNQRKKEEKFQKKQRKKRKKLKKDIIFLVISIIQISLLFFWLYGLNSKKSEYEIMDEALKEFEQQKILKEKEQK